MRRPFRNLRLQVFWTILLTLPVVLAAEPPYPDLRVGQGETRSLPPGINEFEVVRVDQGGELILSGDTEIIVHGDDYDVDLGQWGIVSFPVCYISSTVSGAGADGVDGGNGTPPFDGTRGGDGYDLTIRVLNGSVWISGEIKLHGGDGGDGGFRQIMLPEGAYNIPGMSSAGGKGGNFTLHCRKTASLVHPIEVFGGDGGDGQRFWSPTKTKARPSGSGAAGGPGGHVIVFCRGHLETGHIDAHGGNGGVGGRHDGYAATDPGSIPGEGGAGASGGNIALSCLGAYSGDEGHLQTRGGSGGKGGAAPDYHAGYNYDYQTGTRTAVIPVGGGNGGRGAAAGTVTIKAGESFEYTFDSWGAIETDGGFGGGRGGRSYFFNPDPSPEPGDPSGGPVPGSHYGKGGAGGDGGDVTIVSPSIIGIEPESPITLKGGGELPGSTGMDGRLTLVEVDPRFFPETSTLNPAESGMVKALAGQNIELVYTFINDMDVPLEGVTLETWRLSPECCEPARTQSGSIIQPAPHGRFEPGENRFWCDWPHEIAPGASIEWRFQVHIRDTIPAGGVRLNQRVTLRAEYESEIFEGFNDSGEDYAEVSLPCTQRLDVWVYSEQESAGAGQTVTMTVRCANNAQDSASGVTVELSPLPEFLSWEGASPSPMTLGTIAPESSVERQFSVVVENPLREPPPFSFAFDARIRSAELPWSDWKPGKPVALGILLLWPVTPERPYTTRSNRLPSTGVILGADNLSLTPPDIEAYFTTSGQDADTGALIERDSAPIHVRDDFSYNDEDSIRLVAVENRMLPSVSAGAIQGKGTHNLEAHSVFYETVHSILERSLGHAQSTGMAAGQRQELDLMKASYPGFSLDLSLEHTDMAERLNELNLLGAAAMRTSRQHYDDLMLGIHGVASVWDMLPIIGNLGSRVAKWSSRGVAGVVGQQFKNKVVAMGLETGLAADATDFVLKNIPLAGNPLNRFLKKRSIYKNAYSSLVSDNDSAQEAALKTIYFQLGTGELSETFIRNVNHFGQPISEALTTDLEWDSIGDVRLLLDIRSALLNRKTIDKVSKDGIEEGVRLGVEALLRAEHGWGQERLLSLNFGGSHDAALAAGAIARSKLEHESSSAEGFEDAGEFGRLVFNPMTDLLMVAQFVPNKTAQTLARVGSFVTDGLSRYASAGQAWAAGMFLFSVSDIMSLGTESIVEGNLAIQRHSWPDYELVHTETAEPVAETREGSESDPQFIAAYAAIEAAAAAKDLDALADAHGHLSDLIHAGLLAENLTLSRAALLHGNSFLGTPLALNATQVSQAINRYANSVGQVMQSRRDVLVSAWAQALNLPDSLARAQLVASLSAAREAETELARLRTALKPVFDLVPAPDTPQIVMLQSPRSAKVGDTFDLRIEVASLATPSLLDSVEVELRLPEDGSFETADRLQAIPQIEEGRGTHSWLVRVLKPDFHLNSPFILLKDESGEVVDSAGISMIVEPAGAEGIIPGGSGGTLTTPDGTVRLSVAAGDPADLRVYLDQLWTTPLVNQGLASVGAYHFSVQAFDASSEAFVPVPARHTTLRIRYDSLEIPPGHDAGAIQMVYTPDGVTWLTLPSVVDRDAHTVTATLPAFGRFALALPDTIAPPPPTGVTVSSSDGLLRLSWTESSGADLAGYGIRVRFGDGPGHTLGAVRATETAFVMKPQLPLRHQFEVYAFDHAGNPSSQLGDFTMDDAPNRGKASIGHPVQAQLIPVNDRTLPGGRALYLLRLNNLSAEPIVLDLLPRVPELTTGVLTSQRIILEETAVVALEVSVGLNAAPGEHMVSVEVVSEDGTVASPSASLILEHWSDFAGVSTVNSGGSIVRITGRTSSDLYSATGLIDGSSTSGWRSDLFETGPVSVVIQLAGGAVFAVDGLRLDLTPLLPEADPAMAPAEVSVWVSDSGLQPGDFVHVTTHEIPPGALESAVDWDPVPARFVMLEFSTNRGSPLHLEVAEVEIQGTRQDIPLNPGALRDHLLNRQLLSPERLIPYDLNGDGKVDVSDLIRLLKSPQ